MAWSESFICGATLVDALTGVQAIDLDTDSIYIALYNNTIAPSVDDDPNDYDASPWNANEVTGTGWSSGGVALASPTFTGPASGYIKFDATDVSESGTTLSNAYGALIYSVTGSNEGIVAVYFGGSPYSTSNGTFGITWDTNGIFRILCD